MVNTKPKKLASNFTMRVDKEFLAAIADIQRLDLSAATVPKQSDVVRKAVFELRDRLQKNAERRK